MREPNCCRFEKPRWEWNGELENPGREMISQGRATMGSRRQMVTILALLVLNSRFGELEGVVAVGGAVALANPRNNGSIIRVQSERGAALVLPLTGSETQWNRLSDHRRGLTEDARMQLHDDMLHYGLAIKLKSSGVPLIYYSARVFIGTPPQEFSLIVDTGSTVTYVPCSSCTHCGHHQNPRFNPENSTSYRAVPCGPPDCLAGSGCDVAARQCRYERMYAEQSSSRGLLAKDLVGFGETSKLPPQELVFGCETAESGELYLQRADGILGLGRGQLSVVDQMAALRVMEDSFSLCYGGMDEGGGGMVLGAVPVPKGMQFVESDPHRSLYYNLELSEIQVQGVALDVDSKIFNGKFGTILDSGTTYAYLPGQAFVAFSTAVIQQVGALQSVDGPDPNYPDVCFAGAGTDPKQLDKHFPRVELVFAGNVKISLAPENYLFKHQKVSGAYCLGFFESFDATTMLGGIVVRNTLVTYDRRNHQIGFLKTNCQDLWSVLPSVDVPPRSTQSPPPLPEAGQEFGSVEFIIGLAANLTTFTSETPLFLSSIAPQLDVSPSQVSVNVIKEEANGQIVVRCTISERPSHYFSTTSAKMLAERFQNQSVLLPEIFGAYHLISWKPLTPSKWDWSQSTKMKSIVFISVSVGLLVMLASIAGLAYWYFAKYRHRDQVRYDNLNEIELSEKDTSIGEVQL